jgi:hypothetical protein
VRAGVPSPAGLTDLEVSVLRATLPAITAIPLPSAAVEVISPGSGRLDTIVKRDEYADAGIPHYWVVDLGEPGDRPQLTAHHLAGESGSVDRPWADAGPVAGTFTATEPFPVRIDLDALV